MDRYQVREGSALGHCCVKWSVVDTSIKDAENYEDLLCECLEKDAAEKIATAMNVLGSGSEWPFFKRDGKTYFLWPWW